MDAERFDSIARWLTAAPSRRGLVRLGFGGLLTSLLGLDAVEAKRRGKGKGKKKKKGGAQCTGGQGCGTDAYGNCTCATPATGGPNACLREENDVFAQSCADCPPGRTCVGDEGDGIVVCAKPCGARANGQTCADRSDCAGALCSSGTCQACTANSCSSDANGQCFCDQPATGGPRVCTKGTISSTVDSCARCVPGETCLSVNNSFGCYKRCGAA